MLRHLAPVIIPKTIGNPPSPNAAYKIVEELASAIKDPNIRNIAVSADYGAGKSSVVETAKEKIAEEEDIRWWKFRQKRRHTKFLTISLAQLNTDNVKSQKGSNNKGKKLSAVDREHDIENSLLQQLLYYDQPSKTPKSRFYRLNHIPLWKPALGSLGVLLAVICSMILLEPEKFKVASFYKHFAVSDDSKFVVDCIAAILLCLLFIFFCVWFLLRARVRVSKVKVKDTEVEVNNFSLFNQYLDEIIYFFVSTRYNVVVFEDLDRFEDISRIFGKLRELNKILNSSQHLKSVIKKKITFIYSVRDDLFDATLRVKFFDYIVPVIPVVNSSNAYEKLSEFLDEEDKRDFDGKDLLNLCEYFDDMRLMINIVNEYDLYKKIIRLEEFKLSRKKLFGLIVYKNYCPHDFILLQNRRGVLAEILDNKAQIIKEVENARIARKELEENKLRELRKNSSDWEKELRQEYVDVAKKQTGYRDDLLVDFVLPNGVRVSFERVVEEAALFDNLVNDKLTLYASSGQHISINKFADWQKAVNSKTFQERNKQNPYSKAIINQQESVDRIQSSNHTLADPFFRILNEEAGILDNYLDVEPVKGKPYIPKIRHELLRFLLTHDFLDEHYLDYITYFYQNSIGLDDKRFILNVTSLDKEVLPHSFHLQNPGAVANRFEISDYQSNERLLNVDLALALTREGDKQKQNRRALQLLAKRNKAVDFILALYEKESGKDADRFLSETLSVWDFGVLLNSIEDSGDERLPKLREINLRYADLTNQENFNVEFQLWLNGHYGYVSDSLKTVGEERIRSFIGTYKIKFTKINLFNTLPSFAQFIIEGGYFSINVSNVENIAAYQGFLEEYKRAAFTTLYHCKVPKLASLIKECPQAFIKIFPATSVNEEEWAKTIIAADDKIPSITKKEYLRKQETRIQDATLLVDSSLDFVFKNSLIVSSWKNLYYLCFEKRHAIPVIFLKHNTLENFLALESEKRNDIVNQWVFSTELPFEVYRSVVVTMFGFKQLIEGIEFRRVDILVSNGLLLFNAENYAIIKRHYSNLAVKFLCGNMTSYLEDVTKFPVSSSEMYAALKFLALPSAQSDYLAKRPMLDGKMSIVLADRICELIYKRYVQFDKIGNNLLIESIRCSSNIEMKLYVARKTIFESPYSKEYCTEILIAMGGEYSNICELGSFSWLKRDTNNLRIVKYLSDNSFIKGYTLYENRIKILK